MRLGQLQPYTKYQLNTIEPTRPQQAKPKAKPLASGNTPTARLSTDESFELQQKKINAKKNAAKRGPQQPRTLDLALSADPTPVSITNSPTRADLATNYSYPNGEESVIPGLDGQASLPLQDISANSPQRPSITSADSKVPSRDRSSSAESLIRPVPAQRKTEPTKEPTPDSVIPADTEEPNPAPPAEPPKEKDYSDILAQLRANRKPVPFSADANATRRRGRRQLGRATSTRSNDSTAAEGSGQLNLDGDDDKEQAQEYQPSQELGWDSPGAVKAREQMIKRLGGTLTEKSVRVEGIGIVRDVVSENAGGRVPRKRRERGF